MSYKAVQINHLYYYSKNVFTSENIAGFIYMGQWWNIYLSIPNKTIVKYRMETEEIVKVDDDRK